MGFPGGSVVKNLSANAGDAVSTPGLGRPPGDEMATHSSVLAWEIPWTEEPTVCKLQTVAYSRLQSMGLQKSWT